MKLSWRWMLLLGVLLLVAGYGLSRNLEKVSTKVRIPASAEARLDDYLAAQRVLEKLGLTTRIIAGRSDELSGGAGSVVIWPAPRGAIAGQTLEAIDAFVRRGGHLIVESQYGLDPAMSQFGVERELDIPDHDDCEDGENPSSDEACEESSEAEFDWDDEAWVDTDEDDASDTTDTLTRTTMGLDALPPLSIDTGAYYRLVGGPLARWQLGDEGHAKLLHWSLGQGRVTAMVSLGPFSNSNLAQHDHAEALHRLIQQTEGVDEVLIIRRVSEGFFSWLGTHAWRVLILFGLFLALSLWALIPRFGPVGADPAPVRRRLLDHLRASGRLLWSANERALLTRAATEAALRRVRGEYPHTQWFDAEEMARFLRQRFDLDAALSEWMLHPDRVQHPTSFIALVRACRRIQNVLSPRRADGQSGNPLYDE